MSFDLIQLADAIARHGPVARVVVAATAGSTPREVGASMLVWQGGQSGTIGGGELEYRATEAARELLVGGGSRTLIRVPLGPDLGQCCGGAVTLLTERFAEDDLTGPERDGIVARAVMAVDTTPLAVKRVLDKARAKGLRPAPQLLHGWMIEPLTRPTTPIWIYGAGHVGRALVNVLSPVHDLAITWVDTGTDRFPDAIAERVTALPAPHPAVAARLAPHDAHHLVLTYSHSLDLDLCHAILSRPFAGAGLIGSATKWARFRKRLAALGHSVAQINRIQCPIGDPGLGKTPQAIAIGVASALLKGVANKEKINRGMPGDRRYAPRKRAIDT
ncbi:molybdenum cofactor sulfurylase [Aliiroseovarius sediminilitoris]|uniref:Molybdenum cofactor sulfurylase n=1 Tax=Aliiroseovarius sediminilitoris TaxID=1173584 RepID=A0A1I0NEA1_9RHOB|nr:xanthine dehydrogenase accessory protein XdhC [Aliiroseovarius sediminilitoris]SEV99439.1 molybdenum cofactor sulfurylase [Aliiroseovarius sediminilitoris]